MKKLCSIGLLVVLLQACHSPEEKMAQQYLESSPLNAKVESCIFTDTITAYDSFLIYRDTLEKHRQQILDRYKKSRMHANKSLEISKKSLQKEHQFPYIKEMFEEQVKKAEHILQTLDSLETVIKSDQLEGTSLEKDQERVLAFKEKGNEVYYLILDCQLSGIDSIPHRSFLVNKEQTSILEDF